MSEQTPPVGRTGEHRAIAGPTPPERFGDPGLQPHEHRSTDRYPEAARRAERQVTSLFGLSILGTVVFLAGYVTVQLAGPDDVALSTRLLGGGLGVALLGIGLGAVHWAKTLMPDDEIVEERHPASSSPEVRAEAAATLAEANEETGFGRRKLMRRTLFTALGALGLPALFGLRDLGPLPRTKLEETPWRRGVRMVTDPTGRPVRPEDIPLGGVVHVVPEGVLGSENVNDTLAKAAVLLIRVEPGLLRQHGDPKRANWDYQGIVAYSKICTHVGCPVGLYQQLTHQLLCPCHQSTFDVLRNCAVVFGPAARPLPQLPVTVDPQGYLVAAAGFAEPVGPSFWERG